MLRVSALATDTFRVLYNCVHSGTAAAGERVPMHVGDRLAGCQFDSVPWAGYSRHVPLIIAKYFPVIARVKQVEAILEIDRRRCPLQR